MASFCKRSHQPWGFWLVFSLPNLIFCFVVVLGKGHLLFFKHSCRLDIDFEGPLFDIFPYHQDQFFCVFHFHRPQVVCCGIIFTWNVGFDEVELNHSVASMPERWRFNFGLEELRYRFVICEDDDRLGCTPETLFQPLCISLF